MVNKSPIIVHNKKEERYELGLFDEISVCVNNQRRLFLTSFICLLKRVAFVVKAKCAHYQAPNL